MGMLTPKEIENIVKISNEIKNSSLDKIVHYLLFKEKIIKRLA